METIRSSTHRVLLTLAFFALTGAIAEVQAARVEVRDQSQVITSGSEIIRESLAKIGNVENILKGDDYSVLAWTETLGELKQEYYAIQKADGTWTRATSTAPVIRLNGQDFDPAKHAPAASRWDQLLAFDSAEPELFIVQYKTQFVPGYKKAMEAAGAKIYRYVPNQAHIVKMSPQAAAEVSQLGFVRWVGHYNQSFKSETEVRSDAVFFDSAEQKRYVLVAIDKADKAALLSQVDSLGGKIISRNNGSHLMELMLDSFAFDQLSRSASVLWIEPATEIGLDVNNARKVGGANALESRFPETEGRFTGIGVNGHVLEGIYADHEDFEENEHRKAPIEVEDGASAWHGQNTFGIIFGSGKGNEEARGLLPNAQGFYTSYNHVYSSEPGTKEKGGRYELVKQLVEDHNVMFQTASWGYGRTKEYDARSLEMDEIIFDFDIPITQSQSNAGDQMSRPQAWAKNIISVGAAYHYDNDDFSDDKWKDGFSGASIGPAADGRIKPDLSAFYDKILTTDRKGYNEDFGGTSGATPIVAGHVGLSLEMWTDGVFKPVTVGASRFENRPHAATVKALLINSAYQYAFEGKEHDRTRVHQGWGFPNVETMFDNKDRVLVVNESKVLKALETAKYTVNVAAETPEFKATLVYSDPPGTVGAKLARVNNLDLKVTAPDGTVYFGNNGLLESPYSKAGGTANEVDTVENVFLKDPAAGTYTVEVIAAEINQDGHVETEEVDDADFALVVSGIKKQ